MKHSRRIGRLVPTCALITLAACAGEVDLSAWSPSAQDESADRAFDAPAQLQDDRSDVLDPMSGDLDARAVAVSAQPLSALVQWTDDIQNRRSTSPWGFNQVTLEYPIGTSIAASSVVNLTRVPNPIAPGFALLHTATFDAGGARSQAGIYSFANATFNQLAKSPNGVWVAQEWYFPRAISSGTSRDTAPWINLWDWHSTGPNGDNRWDTQPGLMLAQDGSMKVKWAWHNQNEDTDWSTLQLPVGRWFDIEMHYVWTDAAFGATISLWIDGQLALEQGGVKTKDASHTSIETYLKFYGSSQATSPGWGPRRVHKFLRNVRMAGERIWY